MKEMDERESKIDDKQAQTRKRKKTIGVNIKSKYRCVSSKCDETAISDNQSVTFEEFLLDVTQEPSNKFPPDRKNSDNCTASPSNINNESDILKEGKTVSEELNLLNTTSQKASLCKRTTQSTLLNFCKLPCSVNLSENANRVCQTQKKDKIKNHNEKPKKSCKIERCKSRGVKTDNLRNKSQGTESASLISTQNKNCSKSAGEFVASPLSAVEINDAPNNSPITRDNIDLSLDASPVLRRSLRRSRPVNYSDFDTKREDSPDEDSPKQMTYPFQHKSTPPLTTISGLSETTKVLATKKHNAKLAPIFLRGKNKEREASPEITKEDSWIEAARKAFLFSGLPDQVKKLAVDQIGAAAEEANSVCEFMPWPLVSHVQQTGDCSWVWNLIDHSWQSRLKYSDISNLQQCDVPVPAATCSRKAYASLIQCQALPNNQMCTWTVHSLDRDVVQDVVNNLSITFSLYPWKNVYSDAIKKESSNLETQDTSINKVLLQSQRKDNELPPVKNEVGKRRSSRKKRNKNEEVTVAKIQDSVDADIVIISECLSPKRSRQQQQCSPSEYETKVNARPKVLQWTDKYHPESSGEVIGNGGCVKRLCQWLKDWKHRTDRHTNILKQRMMKVLKKNRIDYGHDTDSVGGCSDDSSSDFQWSDCDDDNISNFIINDDGCGSGDDENQLCNTMVLVGPSGVGKTCAVYAIAKELSYRVFEVNSGNKRNGKNLVSQLKECTQSHQVNKNKYNCDLIKDGGLELVESSRKCKKTGKKGKEKTDNNGINKSKDRSGSSKVVEAIGKYEQQLKDSAASLILFEEADIVFDDDDGYWQAVNNFMATTKRPIILTSNNTNFTSKLKEQYDVLIFKTPTLVQMCGYLQCIALAEGVLACAEGINQMIIDTQYDLRQCLLQLQYLIESGIVSSEGTTTSLLFTKSKLKRAKKFVLDDGDEDNPVRPPGGLSLQCYPIGFRSVLDKSCNPCVLKHLQTSGAPVSLYSGHYVKYSGAHSERAPAGKKHKRILDFSFDTEDSADDSPSKADRGSAVLLYETSVREVDWGGDVGETLYSMVNTVCRSLGKHSKHVALGIDCMSDMYDRISMLDAVSSNANEISHLHPSVTDDARRYDDRQHYVASEADENITNLIQMATMLSSNILCRQMSRVENLVGKDALDELSIPLHQACDKLSYIQCSHHNAPFNPEYTSRIEQNRHITGISRCSSQLLQHAFDHVSTNKRVFHMDYISTLQSICRCEHLRQVANMKRKGRFLHYLDGVGLHLKPSFIEQLISSYQ